MGKIKNVILPIMEMVDDGKTPRQIALYMGMSVDEVIQIIETFGLSVDFDYEQT